MCRNTTRSPFLNRPSAAPGRSAPAAPLAGIDRVEQDAFQLREHPDRLQRVPRAAGRSPRRRSWCRRTTSSRFTTPGQPSFSAVRQARSWTICSCLSCGARVPMPRTGMPAFSAHRPATSPACVARRAGRMHQPSITSPRSFTCPSSSSAAVDVAQRPGRVRPAAGDDVDGLPPGAPRGFQPAASISGGHVGAAGMQLGRGAVQVVEEHVAVLGIVGGPW